MIPGIGRVRELDLDLNTEHSPEANVAEVPGRFASNDEEAENE
jgi:hypothetical protein